MVGKWALARGRRSFSPCRQADIVAVLNSKATEKTGIGGIEALRGYAICRGWRDRLPQTLVRAGFAAHAVEC